MVGFNIQAKRDSERALNEAAHEHEILLARYAPTAIHYVADESTKRASPNVQQTIDSSDLERSINV